MREPIEQAWNLIREVNWIITLLAAIPLSIAANLLTPVARNFFVRRSRVRRVKLLEELQAELTRIECYKKVPNVFWHDNFASLFRVLILLSLAGLTSSVLFFIGAPLYLMAVIEAWGRIKVLANVGDYNRYREDLEKRIAELQALRTESKE